MELQEVPCPHCANIALRRIGAAQAVCPLCGCAFRVGHEALVIISCNGCETGQRELHPDRPRAQWIEKDIVDGF